VTEFLSALGLALVLEGLAYAAFGPWMKRNMAALLSLPPTTLRAAGLGCAAFGLVLLWAVRG
jgi:uncharacterized protein YjeT (DUF2065 family)